MIPVREALQSSIVKKWVTTATGLLLVGFLATHLFGNIGLYSSHSEMFNGYTQGLHDRFGPLLIFLELGLGGLFLVHIVNGLMLKKSNKDARPKSYARWKTKGGHSNANFSSLSMALTGMTLTVFLIVHIIQFRFGPAQAEGYVTNLEGRQVRDLYRLVNETFRNPGFVVLYVLGMLALWTHLKHGFWSAFQSLGAMSPRVDVPVKALSFLVALVLAFGFLFIPIWIYVRGGA